VFGYFLSVLINPMNPRNSINSMNSMNIEHVVPCPSDPRTLECWEAMMLGSYDAAVCS
jgi:hypothetical protein